MLHRDFRLEVLRLLVERLTGRKIAVLSAEDLEKDYRRDGGSQPQTQPGSAAPERSGWGLIYNYSETYAELETTSFNAGGIIRTADGREISFATELTMSRSFFSETHISLRAGDQQIPCRHLTCPLLLPLFTFMDKPWNSAPCS